MTSPEWSPGYTVFLGAPTALQTALALRQAIWRKADPEWAVCGLPATLYSDHGSDFTSAHMTRVCADLGFAIVAGQDMSRKRRQQLSRNGAEHSFDLAVAAGLSGRGVDELNLER